MEIVILGNGVDWCEISLGGFKNKGYLWNKKIPVNGFLKEKIAKVIFSNKINKHIKVPFKQIWYSDVKRYIKANVKNKKNFFLLIYDHNVWGGEESFIYYIKKIYPNIKIGYIFTNIISKSAAKEKGYVERLSEWYDVVFAFDPEDAKVYNFAYSPLIYDPEIKIDKTISSENSVFYIGQAKDRLPILINVYEKLNKLKIKTNFHIVGVADSDKKYSNSIIYNRYIPYSQALTYINESTCLLDVIQGESTGLTIKVCEAIVHNKKLITTNENIKEYPFYDARFIKIIKKADEIDYGFFKENLITNYSNVGKKYFSVNAFIDRLNNELEMRNIK